MFVGSISLPDGHAKYLECSNKPEKNIEKHQYCKNSGSSTLFHHRDTDKLDCCLQFANDEQKV